MDPQKSSIVSEKMLTSNASLTAVEEETKQWYALYYKRHGEGRNDLLTNPEVMFQTFAFDSANIRALRRLSLDRERARVLDIGCGSGASLLSFLRLGFRSRNLAGIDVNPDRIAIGIKEFPNIDFRCESATQLSHQSDTFDLVCESTMFVQITDEKMAGDIAKEMVRVTRPGGFLLLTDWRYGKPRNPEYRALSKRRMATLFDIGVGTEVVCTERGALVPPLGRALSRWAPGLYFAFQSVLPFAAGQTSTVLRKTSSR
jgi:SAM-dependent methyltransferase